MGKQAKELIPINKAKGDDSHCLICHPKGNKYVTAEELWTRSMESTTPYRVTIKEFNPKG